MPAKLIQSCPALCNLLSMGFSRQEYWSGLPFPTPGDLPDPGIEPKSPVSPALQADSLLLESPITGEAPSLIIGGGVNWGIEIDIYTLPYIKSCWRRKWQPTPVFLPREYQGRGSWWAAVYGVTQSQTRLK